MKLKLKDPFIPTDGTDPFVNCKLDRKQYATVLTDIVSCYADGFVLGLNNKWGTGKTTFIKMWEQQLKNEGYKTLYFNAWENDFQEDVLVALLAELEVLNDTKTEKNFKKVLTKAAPLIKKAGLGLLKGLSKKIGADEMVQAIIEGTTEATLKGLENEIETYTKRKKGVQDFRETLGSYVELLSKDKPVVFIIDELDRCRPNYAVKVLEKMKHLFSVKGIIYVLAIDKEQLEYAIKGVYGNDNIDAVEYLRRFIDLEYSIPEPSLKDLIEYLFDYFEFDEFYDDLRNNSVSFRHEKDSFLNVYQALFSNRMAPIRMHEKLFSRLRLIVKSFKENQYSFPEIIILFLYIKTYERDLYNDILNKTYTAQELLNKLDLLFVDKKEEIEKNALGYAVARFVFYYCNYFENSGGNKMVKYDSDTKEYFVDLNFALNQEIFASSFIFINNDFNIDTLSLSWLIKRVELTEKLNS